MSVAQWERETIVERTKEALSHQKGQRRAYCRSVYGFRVLNGDLVEDAEKQAVVAGIQRMRGCLCGRSLLISMSRGFPTPLNKDEIEIPYVTVPFTSHVLFSVYYARYRGNIQI